MHPESPWRAFLLSLVAICLLSACASSSSGLVDSLKYAGSGWFGGSNDVSVKLAPGIRYLRVVSGGRVNYLALGYSDPQSMHGGQPDIEVWYSARRETLRLMDGHLVSAAGLPAEWLDARFESRPGWTTVGIRPQEFLRERDVMPGHRFRIQDRISIVQVQPPAETDLRGVDASSLAWFMETLAATTGDPLPPAYFGVRMGIPNPEVVYTYQCISESLCFSTQQWPPTDIVRKR